MFWNVNADFSFTLAGYGPYTDNAPGNLWSGDGPGDGSGRAFAPAVGQHGQPGDAVGRGQSAFNFTVAGYGPYTDNAPGNLWSATAVSAGP